jgi:Helix-hairpin-helix motif
MGCITSSHRGRSHHELLLASGSGACPADFEEILRTLTGEFGIISRIELQGVDDGTGDQKPDTDEDHYRLTHDVLVTPLRAWLARKAASDWRSHDEFPADGHTVPQPIGREPSSRKARKFEAASGPRAMERPIGINSATEDELKTLPGIGPATARRMIEGRPYGTFDDLLRIKGMSRTRLSEIRPFVALG